MDLGHCQVNDKRKYISIHTTVQPVFVRKKSKQNLTRRHLHQCVDKHRDSSSSIRKHFRDKHSLAPKDLTKNFSVLITEVHQQTEYDCLINEMFFYSRTETYPQCAIALYSCKLRFLIRFYFFYHLGFVIRLICIFTVCLHS